MSNSTDNMASELPEVQEGALAHPAGESGEESASANPIGEREVNDLDQDNIISDGSERAAKPTEFKGDEQLDAQVEEVAKSDVPSTTAPLNMKPVATDENIVRIDKPITPSKVGAEKIETMDAPPVTIDTGGMKDDDGEYQPPPDADDELAEGQTDAALEGAEGATEKESLPGAGKTGKTGGSITEVDPANILPEGSERPARPHESLTKADEEADAIVDEVLKNDPGM